MIHKLREYIDMLFAQAPATKKTVEVKEEILQNLTDKYNDLIAEGKSEEAAYNIAIASIGDIHELIRELKGTPVYEKVQAEEYEQDKQRRAAVTAGAVALYILSVLPFMLFGGVAGPVLFFLMVAAATGLLIYNNMTKPRYMKTDDTLAEEFKEWRQTSDNKRAVRRSVIGAVWAIAAAVYFLVSFATMRWWITWVIFFIALAVTFIIRAAFDLKK